MSELTLAEQIAQQNKSLNYLCLPAPAKVLQVTLDKNNYTFGFLINRGYLETETLDMMTLLLSAFTSNPDVKFVGETEKIIYNKKNVAHYRQRIFFKNIDDVMKLCSEFGLYIYIPHDCQINIHHMLGVRQKDMLSLDRYAHKNNMYIQDWLNLTFYYQLYLYLEEFYAGYLTTNTMKVCENYLKEHKYNNIILDLQDKTIMQTYLQNAPYYVHNYNLELHLEELYFWDKTDNLENLEDLSGYTKNCAKSDFPELFKEETSGVIRKVGSND